MLSIEVPKKILYAKAGAIVMIKVTSSEARKDFAGMVRRTEGGSIPHP